MDAFELGQETFAVTFTVASDAELQDALVEASAAGGATIYLEPVGGTYQIDLGQVDLGTADITLASADPSAPVLVEVTGGELAGVTLSDGVTVSGEGQVSGATAIALEDGTAELAAPLFDGAVAETAPAQQEAPVVIVVTAQADIAAALEQLSAGNGGIIKLDAAGGPYNLGVYGQGTDAGTITITSLDQGNPAQVTRIAATDSKNITFSGLDVDSSEVYQTRSAHLNDVDVYRTVNVAIENCTFTSTAQGKVIPGTDYVMGETLGKTMYNDGFTFSGNVVANYGHGLLVAESQNTTIEGNDISGIQFDGLRFYGVQNTLIEGNALHDFLGSTHDVNHDDMIQIWSNGAESVTENLTIRGNSLIAGSSTGTQTIFIRNEAHKDDANAYKNIVIEDNTIYNGHTHGISVGGTIGLTISNNTVLYNPQAGMQSNASSTPGSTVPTIRVDTSKDVTVTDNISGGYWLSVPADTITAADNVTVDFFDSKSAFYAGKHFVNVLEGGDVDLRDLMMLETSSLAGTGSSAVQPEAGVEALTAAMRLIHGEDYNTVYLDGRVSADAGCDLGAAEGVRYVWTFADGTTAEGEVIKASFSQAGTVDVMLTLFTADGRSDSILRSTEIDDPVLLDVDFNGDLGDDSSYNRWVYVKNAALADALVAGADGMGIHVGGAVKAGIGRYSMPLGDLEKFSLGVDFKLDNGSAWGPLTEKIGLFSIQVKPDGTYTLSLTTSDGTFTASSAAGLTDDVWHHLDMVYDGAEATLYIDGLAVIEMAATGTTMVANQDMVFGSTFGNSVAATYDNVEIDMRAPSASEIAQKNGIVPEPTAGDLLHVDFNGDLGDDSGSGVWTYVKNMLLADALVAGTDGMGIHTGGDVRVGSSRYGVSMANLEGFTVGADIRLDSADAWAPLIEKLGLFRVGLDEDGSLYATLGTTDGSFALDTDIGLGDTGWHRIDLAYDGAQLTLFLAGDVAGAVAATGQTVGSRYDLTLGSTWGKSVAATFDDLSVNSFGIDEAEAEERYDAMLCDLQDAFHFAGEPDTALAFQPGMAVESVEVIDAGAYDAWALLG